MYVSQLFEFMTVAEKRHELDTAALKEKLSAIQTAQQEIAGSWKPQVDQALGDLTGAVRALKERVDELDTQSSTAVARAGHGAVMIPSTVAVARLGHGL
ncbi:hypothetical protein QYE76_015509 [Lolium multiflorum]|uniref:Uncharacterized protein n=1 Tax=Lolium multiflorum TaxID=4521 RepID=A0AAD8U4Y6_LOLMU|nr:hypothetical protein QYE76_015509 [Lolium multiflorum]